MKKRTKFIGIVVGAAILVLGAGYTVFIAPRLEREQWVYIESKVERGTLTVGVTESGSLEYGITSILYDLDLSVSEQEDDEEADEEEEETIQKYLKVEKVYVTEGQRVQEGDALLKFTQDSVESVRTLLEGALVDAKASYNEAENEYELAVLEAETDYETKLISQKYAAEIYNEEESAVGDEIASMQIEIQMRTANIAALEEKVAEATEDYEDAYEIYENAKETMSDTDTKNASNFMTIQTEYLNAQTKFRNAESTLTQAKENLEDNAAQIAELESQVAAATERQSIDELDVQEEYLENVINGENAQITYDATVESLKEDLQKEEKTKQKVKEQLDAFEAFVGEDGILYAEGDGIITELGYEAEDRLVNTGIVVSYAAPSDMTITVDVTQEDVVALDVGNRVEIQFSAYPDTVYEGTILSIHTTATSRESATISYQVVIGVEGDTKSLYGGMNADITFVTEEKEDVMFVSRKAVVEQNGKTYVYVKTTLGGKELQEVQTGIRNSTSIEIVSGLEEGDTIYIVSRVSDEEAVEEQEKESEETSDSVGSLENGQMLEFLDDMDNTGEMPDMGGNMPDFGGNMPGMGDSNAPGMEGRP